MKLFFQKKGANLVTFGAGEIVGWSRIVAQRGISSIALETGSNHHFSESDQFELFIASSDFQPFPDEKLVKGPLPIWE